MWSQLPEEKPPDREPFSSKFLTGDPDRKCDDQISRRRNLFDDSKNNLPHFGAVRK